MDVTRHNVHEALPKFMEALALCDFYALDEEMTGISAMRGKDTEFESPIADPATAYSVGRKVASKYQVTQVGISMFRRVKAPVLPPLPELQVVQLSDDADDVATNAEDSSESAAAAKYEVTTFNFHVIPPSRGTDLIVNAETAKFLRRNSFDFNQWLDNGIPYVARPPPKRRVTTTTEIATTTTTTTTPPSVEKMVDNAEPLPEIGFKSVYQVLVSSRKPFVGHNCFNDLLFLTTHFGSYTTPSSHSISRGDGSSSSISSDSSPLPADYPTYKRWLRTQFPLVYDTKRICADLPVGTFAETGTALGSLYNIYKGDVTVELKLSTSSEAKGAEEGGGGGGSASEATTITELAHHAGYDAMMTGVVFLGLKKQLSDDGNSSWCDSFFDGGAEGCAFTKAFANQIALFRSVYTCDLSTPYDSYLPNYGAAVLKLVPGTGINRQVEKKSEHDGENVGIPERLDNALICGCVREMLPPKEALKTKDSSIFYYRLNRSSAVVWLPEHATLKLSPREHVQAKMFQPVGQRVQGAHPDPFYRGKLNQNGQGTGGGILRAFLGMFRRR